MAQGIRQIGNDLQQASGQGTRAPVQLSIEEYAGQIPETEGPADFRR